MYIVLKKVPEYRYPLYLWYGPGSSVYFIFNVYGCYTRYPY
jgi:hypothetical protein